MNWTTMRNHLHDSFKSIWRNGWMAFAAISGVAVTILLVGISLALVFNVTKLSHDVENDVRVQVSIEPKTTDRQEAALKAQLQKIKHVDQVTFSSKENELKKVVRQYGNSFEMFNGDDNPLSDVFVVRATDPEKTVAIAKQAKKLDHVARANYGGTQTKKLFKTMNDIRNWGMAFSVLLLVVAIFLIANTIRITILSRQNEIEIMRLVGATRWYIRWPFILEGAWTGLLGAILPLVIIDFGYVSVYNGVGQQLTTSGYHLLTPNALLLPLNIALIVIAMLIGSLGAAVSMRRFLKI
ncbi:permease-like cell division protein FtsX [Lapidilactobacillus dextrinicus]|uniref:permease-like cell division protein FtsX n=1 Tax=Lapidilactobacillus dextrinicus TaxID=51664 RepID=UPI0022DF655F|nr:permease-like cell division protein FtsX [Lapidilactobacillus dextrinicus]